MADKDIQEGLEYLKQLESGETVAPQDNAFSKYGELTTEDLESAHEEEVLAREFGNPVTAAALGAARGATLGLSDVALTAAGVDLETIKAYKEQSPLASSALEVAGTVAPAFFTGGAAIPAKAAQTAATAAGKLAAKKVSGQIAKKAVELGAAGAVEGGLYGAGQLASDVALKNQKLSVESLVGNVGPGALLGGGFGALLGGAAGVATKTFKTAAPLVRRVEQFGEDILDPVKNAETLSGLTPSRLQKLNDMRPEGAPSFSDDILDYTRKHLVTIENPAATADDLVRLNAKVLDAADKKIDSLVDAIDIRVAQKPEKMLKINPWERLQKVLDNEAEIVNRTKEFRGPQSRFIKQMKATVTRMSAEAEKSLIAGKETVGFKALNEFRKDLQDMAYNPLGTKLENYKANVADNVRAELRNVINEIADAVSGEAADLGTALKEANKTAHVGLTIKKGLKARAAKKGNESLFQLVRNIGGDAKTNLAVLANVGTAVNRTKEVIKDSVSKFFNATKKPALSLTNKGLSASGLGRNQDGSEAKNEKQAFKNMQANLQNLTGDQEKIATRLAKITAPVFNVSPGMGIEAQQQLVKSIAFLQDKLPRSMSDTGANLLFNREYQPTDMELAKFKRYVQIVEQPFTALEELENGTLTREHVEALQAIYPEIYKEMQLAAMDQVIAHPDLPYQKKLQLGILLNIPSDESLRPDAVLGLQQNFTTQPEQGTANAQSGANSGVKSAQAANMDQIDLAGRSASGVQELTERRS